MICTQWRDSSSEEEPQGEAAQGERPGSEGGLEWYGLEEAGAATGPGREGAEVSVLVWGFPLVFSMCHFRCYSTHT